MDRQKHLENVKKQYKQCSNGMTTKSVPLNFERPRQLYHMSDVSKTGWNMVKLNARKQEKTQWLNHKSLPSVCSECSDGIITKSVPLNFERTKQLYESNVPRPLAAPSSSHLPGQDLACTAATDLDLSNLLAWGWVDTDAVHSHHEYTLHLHEQYTWTCLDGIWLRVHVCSSVSMYMHVYLWLRAHLCSSISMYVNVYLYVYLLSSSKLREQKRRYIIYSAQVSHFLLSNAALWREFVKKNAC